VTTPSASIAEYLAGRCAVPGADVFAAAGLAEFGYTLLPPDDEGRVRLRPAYLDQLARHHRLKRSVVPLVRAWRDAGIGTLLFKGFHLAEFVYPTPGSRYYGDIDLAVRSADLHRAVRIAQEMDWTVRALAPLSWGHAVSLVEPERAGFLDLHHLLLHARVPGRRVQRRITEAVWSASREMEWEGIPVRVPDAVDALLVGLILQRCWSPDGWRRKPHDMLDYHLLMDRGDLTRSDLLRRAESLGCARTIRLFIQRCHPDTGILDFSAATSAERSGWQREVRRERGRNDRLERMVSRTYLLPRAVLWTLAVLPLVARVRHVLRRGGDLRTLFQQLEPRNVSEFPGGRTRHDRRKRQRMAYGVIWAFRIFPFNPAGDCLPRALALYVGLRQLGWPATFVSGIRRGSAGIESHAWVELEGRPLDELGERMNRTHYTPQFRWPADGPETDQPADTGGTLRAGVAAARS
jgi:hypothetical protein